MARKPASKISAPAVGNHNVMTAGPGTCAQEMARRLCNNLSSLPFSLKSIDKYLKTFR
jgi:hypothetical protein